MKATVQLLTFAATLFADPSLWAQGSGIINFGNIGTTEDRKIFVCQGADIVPAPGPEYQIALYWGQRGTPEFGLVQVGSPAGFLSFAPGQFSGGNRTVTPLANNGDIVTVQARAWRQIPGVANTYEAVLAAGWSGDPRAEIGKGPVFDHDTSRPGDPLDPPYLIGAAIANYGNPNWQGFVVMRGIICPEPSTTTLAVLGGVALLVIRCWRRGKSGP